MPRPISEYGSTDLPVAVGGYRLIGVLGDGAMGRAGRRPTAPPRADDGAAVRARSRS